MKQSERINHASQVRLLLEHLDPNGTDVVWEKWAHPLLAKKKRAGGTINSYLGSVEKFVTFVTSDRRKTKGMPHLDQEIIEIFKFLKTRLSNHG